MAEVLSVLVSRDHKSRYKSTVMGMLWSVITPVLFLLTFYFLFSVIMRVDIPNYASYVFIGLVAWAWLQTSLLEGVSCISQNASLVNHPGFPVSILPMVSVVSNLINFLFSLPLLIIVVVIERGGLSWTLLFLPLVIFVQLIFQLGLSYFVSAANVTFRDVQFFLPSLLLLGYFTTPIFYHIEQVPARIGAVMALNPVYQIVDTYRRIFEGQMPNMTNLAIVLAGSIAMLWLGYQYFLRSAETFLEDI